MFENILGQPSVVARLRQEVRSGIVPPTLFFVGPDFSGKSSTMLELARVLTCTSGLEDVPWGCRCTSCVQQRHLLHPDTLLTGGRYFGREIRAAVDALRRDRREPLRYLLERSVRKLTRRFDPVLWEGDNARLGKVDPLLEQIDAVLADYLPGASFPDDRRFASGLDKLIDLAAKLEAAVPLDAVPVDVVRRINRWARLSSMGPAKVALIENVDRLGDSARNALLKTLEEPPQGVHFVLTTSRRGAVIATIRSRAREYGFSPRGPKESALVIERIFRDSAPEQASLRDYLVGRDGSGLRPLAERFLERALGGAEVELGLLDEITELVSGFGRGEGFTYFLEELTELLRLRLRSGEPITGGESDSWRDQIGLARARVETFNIPAARAIEGLFYGIAREAG